MQISAVNPGALPPSQSTNGPTAATPTSPSSDIPAYTTPSPPAVDPVQAAEDQARRDRQRGERSQKVAAAAKTQVEEAARFIKERPQNPKLLDYIAEISDLNAAIETNDPDQIEHKSTELPTLLNRDKEYQSFLSARVEEQKHAAAQYLSDAILHAQEQDAFLIDWVSRNPLGSDVGKLIPLIKQIESALSAPDLGQLQTLTEKVDLAIREANLQGAFNEAHDATAKAASDRSQLSDGPKNTDVGQPDAKTTLASIPRTPKNRFLMEGDLNDVIILYSAGAAAPHIAKNLRGDFVFGADSANSCLFGKNPDDIALIVKTALAPYQLRTLIGLNQGCDSRRFDGYDIVAMQRGAFLKADTIDVLSLIKSVEDDNLKQMIVLSAPDLRAAKEAVRATIEQISTDVANGTRPGFGLVLLQTKSANLCFVANDKVEAHSKLLLDDESKISFDMQVNPTISKTTTDEAFIGVQKRLCGAIYASAADLKTLTEAFGRNSLPYTFSSLWFTPIEIDEADAAATERNRTTTQQATERAQKAADESRLRSQRAQDLNATQSAQQVALRDKYADPAKAAVASITEDVTTWTREQRGPVAASYPAYAAWLAEKLSDHWEVMTINSDLQDFGTSTFKGRELDTPFARIKLRLRNQMLGEYQDACFVFGQITDTEFAATREHMFTPCDNEAALKVWQTGHQFQSEWIVTN